MSESFDITFNGAATTAGTATSIKESLEGLADVSDGFGYEDSEGPELIVTSTDAETEVNWLLWDILEQVKNNATVTESDFTSHL